MCGAHDDLADRTITVIRRCSPRRFGNAHRWERLNTTRHGAHVSRTWRAGAQLPDDRGSVQCPRTGRRDNRLRIRDHLRLDRPFESAGMSVTPRVWKAQPRARPPSGVRQSPSGWIRLTAGNH